MYQIPILLIIFRRCDTALKTFERIRQIRPSKLYIAGDGPRQGVEGEAEAVKATRQAILERIDWDCQLNTLFHETNVGCGPGVKMAIDWLFENEEYGIIIEDDCVMQSSFFPFVEEMIYRYAEDSRIGMIDGTNFYPHVSLPDSYGFSRYKATYGWATWRRAWKLMDLEMCWRSTPYSESIYANMGWRSRDKKYWKYRVKAVDYKDVSAWDWQWYFTLSAHNMLAIFPSVNLMTNIGFGEGASHTSSKNTPECFKASDELTFPLQHPNYVLPYEPYDLAYYNGNNTLYYNLMKYLPIPIKMWLKRRFKL